MKRAISLTNLCKILTKKIEKDYDIIIVIDGVTGIGKSTLALHLARRTSHSPFKLSRDLVYSQEDFIKQMKTQYKGKIISDEMINVGFSRDWYNKKQKDIIKLLNMNRDHNNLIILCVPNFADLDKKIMNMCRMRLTVIQRGLAVIQIKNQSIYSTDKWEILVNSRIEREIMFKRKKFTKMDFTKLTTFAGFLFFKPLTELQEMRYRKIKNLKREALFASVENKALQKSKTPDMRIEEALLNGEIRNKEDMTRICGILGGRYDYIYDKIRNRWRKEYEIEESPKDFFMERIIKKERENMERKKKSLAGMFEVDYAKEVARNKRIKQKQKQKE